MITLTFHRRQRSTIAHYLTLFLVINSTFDIFPHHSSAHAYDNENNRTNLQNLINMARQAPPGQHGVDLWNRVLSIDPRNGEAHFRLAALYLQGAGGDGDVEKGVSHLEIVLDGSQINSSPIPRRSPQRFIMANFVGRYRAQLMEYTAAKKYLEMSLAEKPTDTCTGAMVASLLDTYPRSTAAADESLRLYNERMDALIARAALNSSTNPFTPIDYAAMMPVANFANDPYVHCVMSMFYLSFYYRGDVAAAMGKHFQVSTAMFPELLYMSPNVMRRKLAQGNSVDKPCVKRKLRLGVASGFLTEASSVTADFKGVLSELDRDVFEITYIFFAEQRAPAAKFATDARDTLLTFIKDEKSNGGPATRHMWLQQAQAQVAALDLDILYFLDCTMGSHVHRFAFSKLAPVQVVSHGHPVTTGVPREIMDYYISWAGAELEYDKARRHYTEELKLLPGDTLHQYYIERVTPDGRSAIDNLPYKHLVSMGRGLFLPEVPDENSTWYLCMQKPFKLHPEFDDLISGILRADPAARVLLHKEERESNRAIFIERLRKAGCDMDRVHFVPVQPHHRLLALYELSDVVLDSYPAGGCTTTREVLEVGKPVVTLPSKLLGSRWSLAYYNIMGDPMLNELVIARNEQEYVNHAVRLGTDRAVREDAEMRVRENVHKLFRRREAVYEWSKMLLDIAPVRVAGPGGFCGVEVSYNDRDVRDGTNEEL